MLSKYQIKSILLLLILFGLATCKSGNNNDNDEKIDADSTALAGGQTEKEMIHYAEEKHLADVRQLTFGGDNAEAYFSFDNTKIVFQKTSPAEGIPCDQIYMAALQGSDNSALNPVLISTAKGRTTCAFFMPGDTTIIFASTHLTSPDCPPVPDKERMKKYVWPIYNSYEIFIANRNGKILKQLTDNDAYDAEPTVSPRGDKIVFTSTRNGDLDLYTMNLDGSDVRQVTNTLGYDGGAFFSHDGTKLVMRASRPTTPEEIAEYKDLLSQNMVAPTRMEVFVCNIDGSNMKQVTKLGQANWAPFFHPSGEKIIFASNHAHERGFPFNLYLINIDGTGLEKITIDGAFDAFPMFSSDGKKLIWGSNRNNGDTNDTNLFIADWVE